MEKETIQRNISHEKFLSDPSNDNWLIYCRRLFPSRNSRKRVLLIRWWYHQLLRSRNRKLPRIWCSSMFSVSVNWIYACTMCSFRFLSWTRVKDFDISHVPICTPSNPSFLTLWFELKWFFSKWQGIWPKYLNGLPQAYVYQNIF